VEVGFVVEVAEHIAYILTTEASRRQEPSQYDLTETLAARSPELAQRAEIAMQALVRARIGRIDGLLTFSFTHRRFQEHFTAGWLSRYWQECDARSLLIQPRWREPVITALRNGPDNLRRDLALSAVKMLSEETAGATGAVASTAAMIALSPSTPLPAPTDFFIWPPAALHLLQVLTAGLIDWPEVLPTEVRRDSDRLVVSAFTAGMLLDQKRAIEVSATTSAEVALWAADRAIRSDNVLLQRATAQQLAKAPHIFALLRTSARAIATLAAILEPTVIDRAFVRSDRTVSASSLIRTLHDLVRVGQVTAIGLAFYSVQQVISQLIADRYEFFIPHQLPRIAPGLAGWSLLTVSVFVFLGTWTAQRRGPRLLMYVVGVVIVIAAILGALDGLLAFIAAAALTATGRFSVGFHDLVIAYLTTWPMTMAGFVVVGPLPAVGDWLSPQVSLVRTAVVGTPNPFSRMRATGASHQGIFTALATRIRSFVVVSIVVGLVIFAAETPLPMVKKRDIANARTWIFFASLILFFTLRYWLNRWWVYRAVERRLAGDRTGAVVVLQSLQEAGTRMATERILKKLRDAPPGALQASARSLADLARALEHVARMVPAEVKRPIPAAIWDVGPVFVEPNFRDWVSKFDKRYPGRLSWLAARHRGLVAEALDRAETPAA